MSQIPPLNTVKQTLPVSRGHLSVMLFECYIILMKDRGTTGIMCLDIRLPLL